MSFTAKVFVYTIRTESIIKCQFRKFHWLGNSFLEGMQKPHTIFYVDDKFIHMLISNFLFSNTNSAVDNEVQFSHLCYCTQFIQLEINKYRRWHWNCTLFLMCWSLNFLVYANTSSNQVRSHRTAICF